MAAQCGLDSTCQVLPGCMPDSAPVQCSGVGIILSYMISCVEQCAVGGKACTVTAFSVQGLRRRYLLQKYPSSMLSRRTSEPDGQQTKHVQFRMFHFC